MRLQMRLRFVPARSTALIVGLLGAILLEAPAVQAGDYSWNNVAGGDWSAAGNWTPGSGPPGAADNATISTAGTYTVGLTDNRAITNLTLNNATATLSQTAGTLTLGGTLNLTAGTYSLSGGTISGGSITSGGGQLQLQFNNVNILNNVAVGVGVLDFSATQARVRLQGTTTLAAGTVVNLTGNASILSFEQTATAGGAGNPLTINLGSSVGAGFLSVEGNNNVLTLGPAATVTSAAAGGGELRSGLYSGNPGTIRNQGLIQNTGTGILRIDPFAFANQSGGTVRAQGGTVSIFPGGAINESGGTFDVNGGTLSLAGTNWSNAGNIAVSAGSLTLGGSFTTAGVNLPGLTRTGGTVQITGAMANTANTLALTAATGSFQLNGGTISGGSITAAGGNTLQPQNNNNNQLNNVAVGVGVLDFSSSAARVRLQGTTTLAPGTVVNLSANTSILAFEQTVTTSNLSVNMTNGGGSYLSVEGNNTLTLGPATTVTVSGASNGQIAGALYGPGTPVLINQGLIRSTGSSALGISIDTFTNQAGGIVRAESGSVNISSTSLTNYAGTTLTGGTWEVWGGATLNFGSRNIVTLGTGTTVVFNGPGVFTALDTLAINNGTLRVLGGKTFTPTAATVNNAGVLEVGTGSTFGKAINIQAAGRLEGTGTVTGAVTVGGTIAPGSTATPLGTLTTGGQTWAGGGVYEVSYGRESGSFVAGTDNDLLASGGGTLVVTATPGNKYHLRMNYVGTESLSNPDPVTIKIGTFGGGVPATFDPTSFQLDGDFHGSAFQLTSVGNDVFLTFTPVPEPGAMLLIGAAGLGVFEVMRRRRRSLATMPG